MQEEPAPDDSPRRAESVDETAGIGLQFSSSSVSSAKPRRHSAYSDQSGPSTPIPRAYEFVVNETGEMAESRRKRLRQHVMQDYMHRRRTLAAIGAQDTGRIVGWRNVDSPNKNAPVSQVHEIVPDTPTHASTPTPRTGTPTPTSASITKRDKVPIVKYTHPLRVRTASQIKHEDRARPGKHGWPSPASSLFTPMSSTSTEDPDMWGKAEKALVNDLPNPQSPLGAGLVDPFDSFPIPVTPSDQALINHCTSLRPCPYLLVICFSSKICLI
jgi:hypothetical protein